jgi:hypothetical protein
MLLRKLLALLALALSVACASPRRDVPTALAVSSASPARGPSALDAGAPTLAARFDADAGRPRLVLIVSPT